MIKKQLINSDILIFITNSVKYNKELDFLQENKTIFKQWQFKYSN